MPRSALLLFALASLCPAAQAKPRAAPQAATTDANVQRLASDGVFGFLAHEWKIEGAVPAGSTVLLEAAGLDPLLRAALIAEIAGTAGVALVEREALGVERSLPAPPLPVGSSRSGAAAPGPAALRAFDLSVENFQVLAPSDARRWQAPDVLVQVGQLRDLHKATARRLPGGDRAAEAIGCAELRVIDGSSGVVTWEGLRCGETSGGYGGLARELVGAAPLPCGRGGRALQLPVAAISSGGSARLPTSDLLYQTINQALAAEGCRVLDVPPGASAAGGAQLWSYDAHPFEPVGSTLIQGWQPARVVLEVSASPQAARWGSLRPLLEDLDPQLLDPDFQAVADKSQSIPALGVQLRVVDLVSGAILASASLAAGVETPRDVLAAEIADLLLGRPASAWVEVRAIPETALARVGRETPVAGTRVLRLRPGTHEADLFLNLGAKADAHATFAVEGHQWGVLPLAAPFGALEVTTTPEVADIAVDGVSWGPSPVTRTLGGGSHEVRATVAGCGETVQSVQVLVGETNHALVHLPGVVHATAQPPTAEILLDLVPHGTGEVTVTAVPWGVHEVRFRLAGYRDGVETVTVPSCQTVEAASTFQGTIKIASRPGKAEARLDGAALENETPVTVLTDAGMHEVSCHWCEYGAGTQAVNLHPGETVQLSIPLDKSGFRFAAGAHVALGSPGLGVGIQAEGWMNGRWGLIAGAEGVGGFGHYSVGPAVRTRFPYRGAAMPLSLRVDFFHREHEWWTYPAAAIDLRFCVGGVGSVRIGGALGVNPSYPQRPVFGLLEVGALWRAGSRWK